MTTLQKSLFAAVVLTAGFIGGLVVSGRMSLTQPSTAAPRPDTTCTLIDLIDAGTGKVLYSVEGTDI